MSSTAIFVSYRRQDSQGFAGRLADDLIECFGEERIFRDDDIPEGEDFARVLDESIASCQVFLVVIGPSWLEATDSRGRRLDSPNDWVRREIEAGLGRGAWLLPVLVGGARMPASSELPPSIAGLASVQAIEMHDRGWDDDLRRLVAVITKRIPSLRQSKGLARRLGPLPARDLIRHYLRLGSRGGAAAAARPAPTRLGKATGVALRLLKLAVVWLLVTLLAWFLLENYASPEFREGVLNFIAFVREKFLALVS